MQNLGISISHKTEGNCIIYDNSDPGRHDAKENKPYTERQTLGSFINKL